MFQEDRLMSNVNVAFVKDSHMALPRVDMGGSRGHDNQGVRVTGGSQILASHVPLRQYMGK